MYLDVVCTNTNTNGYGVDCARMTWICVRPQDYYALGNPNNTEIGRWEQCFPYASSLYFPFHHGHVNLRDQRCVDCNSLLRLQVTSRNPELLERSGTYGRWIRGAESISKLGYEEPWKCANSEDSDS